MDSKFQHLNRGFTLIELLISMAVIALLISLLVGASYRFVVSAREAATTTTINKASGIIQDRVRAFRETDFTDAGALGAGNWNYNHTSGSWISAGAAEVLFRKGRFKAAFPQCFNDFYNSAASAYDTNKLTRFFGTTTIPPTNSGYNSKYESGIVLYALIMKGETFGATTPGEDTFTSAEVKNSPETGNLPCLVDAWGEPLRFYRWPTRLIRCGEWNFNNSSGSSTAYDDYNQNGLQESPGWNEAGTPVTFSPGIRPNPIAAGTLTAQTPASLLMSNLPPYVAPPSSTSVPSNIYAWGPDAYPGANPNTNSAPYNAPPFTYSGAPDTDDPEPLNVDPDDPGFQLSSWLFNPNFSTATIRSSFISTYHDFYTYHTPLIVSTGPDRQLGLYEPSNSANYGYLAAPVLATSGYQNLQPLFDNITNLNQRAGGK